MAKTELNIIKNWFKTGLKPTQAQFWTTWDSFWHKDEKLPISSIENLGNILDNKAENNHIHNEYATNDATSLNEENVSSWRNSLGIKDVELTDETVKLTQSYEDFGVEAGSSQSLLNQTFASELFNRVEIPEENADADHVLLADGSTLAKTELGSSSTVMGIAPDENKNIDISNVAMDWKNPSQKFSGLQDKSNDGAFNAFNVVDENGNFAKILNVYNALANSLDLMTDEQKNSLATKFNGGYTTKVMTVNSMTPPVISKSKNSLTRIILRGANLNLTEHNKIEILSVNNTVLDVINSSDIQLNNSGLFLSFEYNFYPLINNEKIKFRIYNGVVSYTVQYYLTFVDNIVYRDFSTTQWTVTSNSEIPSNITNQSMTNGNLCSLRLSSGYNKDSDLGNPNYALKGFSSKIFEPNDNFYLELTVTVQANNPFGTNGLFYKKDIVGLATSDVNASDLVVDAISGVFGGPYLNNYRKTIKTLTTREIGYETDGTTEYTFKVIFIKDENMLTTIVGSAFEVVEVSSVEGFYLTSIFNSADSSYLLELLASGYTFNN